MTGILEGFKELVYPKFCIVCSKKGFSICKFCLTPWSNKPKISTIGKHNLFYLSDYNVDTSKVILLAKENGNTTAIDVISSALVESIKLLVIYQKVEVPLNIVTIPSAARAIRARGRDHVSELCENVIKKLKNISIAARSTPLLRVSKNVKDQSRLNRNQRLDNLENAYILQGLIPSEGAFILLDDLVATGSSILEGFRALSDAKITAIGAVTACATGRNSLIR
ncbi:MAG: ComF family protein [Candidatus Nanopelagicus sp.]